MIEKYATHRREPFFEIAKMLIKKEDKVLDIGAGNGAFADFCELQQIYLFEGNINSVDKLKEKYKNVEFGRLPLLPYKNNYFDIIHMSHVIEHLQTQEAYDTLVELDRCCKKGGAIIISAPLMWSGFYDDLSHIKPYNPYVLQKYLCHGNRDNLTREMISDKYNVELLHYRFRERELFYNIKKSSNIFSKIFYKVYKYLRKRGLKIYDKTGYTIVLRKSDK